MTLLALLKKGTGKAEFHRQTVGRVCQAFAKLFLRFLSVTVAQQGIGKMQSQRRVVRRGTQGLAQGLNGVVTREIAASGITHAAQ